MHVNKILIGAGFALSVAAFPGVLTNTAPTLIGPIYVPATNTSSQAFLDASSAAYDAITQAINTGLSNYGPVDNQTTSFSAQVFSAITNETLFEYHFAAPQLNGSLTKGSLTENTIYRTGSLGKLFMMYVFLVDIGDSVFLDSVVKYIVSSERGQPPFYRNIFANFDGQSSLSSKRRSKFYLAIQYFMSTGTKSLWALLLHNFRELDETVGPPSSLPLFEIMVHLIRSQDLLGDLATSGFQAPTLETLEENGYPYETPANLPNCTFYGSNYPTCTRQRK